MDKNFLPKIQDYLARCSSFQVFLIFCLLGLLVYANAIFHPFVHDDVVFIQKNPYIAELSLSKIFSSNVRFGTTNVLINDYYRPLLELLYGIQYKVFHLNPHAYHFFNICLHIVNSFLVYRLIFLLLSVKKGASQFCGFPERAQTKVLLGHCARSGNPQNWDAPVKSNAFVIGIFFLIHPIQTEAVACIAGVSNLVYVFLCLSSLYFYLLQRRLILSAVLFFLALFAKEQSVILPFLILWYELCLGKKDCRGSPCARPFLNVSIYFVILGVYFLLRKILLGSAVGSIFGTSYELWLRILAIPRTLLMYFRVIVLPYDLHYYRSIDILQPVFGPMIIFGVVAGLVVWSIWRAPQPQRRWMIFGVGWVFIALGPMLNILPLINEYSLILTSEHFLYLPLVGVLIFLGVFWGHFRFRDFLSVLKQRFCKDIPRVQEAPKAEVPLFGFMVLVVICMAITIKQNTYWRGEIPLFERVVKYEKNFGRGHILLAKAYLAQGRFQESILTNQKALGIMQGYVDKVRNPEVKNFYLGFIKGIHLDLAQCFAGLGDPQEASRQYQQALQMNADEFRIQKAPKKD